MAKVGYQGKQKYYVYRCPWPKCHYEFGGWLPEDLDNTMIICPNCHNFIRKRDYKEKKDFKIKNA